MTSQINQERLRLEQHRKKEANWKLWGPYLSDRSWGTVREDFSANGEVWQNFTHAQARSRAYRWNEDGIAGISDRNQYLCFALAFWNEQDSILKERFFGLTNLEGNHGEDVKEYYFHLDNTPTHSYMKMLYKYPQAAFPYQELIERNQNRSQQEGEYELLDTGIFSENRYFDLFIEYAKNEQEDILIKITAYNRAADPATLNIIPTLWFRNTWSWGYSAGPMNDVPTRPTINMLNPSSHVEGIISSHPTLGKYILYTEKANQFLFTENETNQKLLFDKNNISPYVKDAFHRYLINGEKEAVNPKLTGTKAGIVHKEIIPAKGSWVIRLRLTKDPLEAPFEGFNEIFTQREQQADEFYQSLQNPKTSDEENKIQRQAFAGLLWTKQLYYFDVDQWFSADAKLKKLPRREIPRNQDWMHLVNFDIISMPDKWEYPWYASWDLAFHCVSFVLIDADFAKRQITLMTREWYMHPNGQLPAYEWNFSDANPPVLAWAAWRVYKIDAHLNGTRDKKFLMGIFQKLLLNFTWWVNRKDADGRNIFQGGFLGLDNISLFDRSMPLPSGGNIDQSDATSWMAFFCILMIKMALELAQDYQTYEDLASKFFEHFLRISAAMVNCGGKGLSLWDHEDGFFYDVIHKPDNTIAHLKVRSLVGLLPLLAVETVQNEYLNSLPVFKARVNWFLNRHPEFQLNMAPIHLPGITEKNLLGILTRDRLISVLRYMLDENEFLSEYGLRSVSKIHQDHPYELTMDSRKYSISYEPAEAQTRLFGGNSNWRGPVWFPLNFLIIESLQKFHYYYGDTLKVECPTDSGKYMTLWEVATELSRRLISLFTLNNENKRPVFGDENIFNSDPHWKDMILFYEYFHGDTGKGLGASHQTGWTGLVAKLIQQSGFPAERTWPKVSKNFNKSV